MDNQKDPLLSRSDNLQAENSLLKLKLRLEYGMQMDDTSSLSPEVENQWLKSVYAFEQQFKNARRISVYDYIGRPDFSNWDALTPDETRKELLRIQTIMEQNDVQLTCLCEYDDAIIYRFVTEELFQHEMDDMRVAGMTCHFTYEEFHPNHDYDLRNYTHDFLKAIFSRPWHEEFDIIHLTRKVSFCGKEYDRQSISDIITTFQEVHANLEIEKLDIKAVVMNEEVTRAVVHSSLSWSGKMKQGTTVRFEGAGSFHFVRDDDYWQIVNFEIPGFSRKQQG
ncbi:MAG TPA: hypothetical protein VFO54_11225 [Chryseosolibacter sp.]|nr:hypothetical protein [Chryseosolibacter sp.]